MIQVRNLAAVALSFVCLSAYADGFGIFSEHEKLKGQVVAYAGSVEKIEIRSSSSGSTKELLKIAGRCFDPTFSTYGYWGYGGKAGLLLVDRAKSISIAILENGIGTVDVKVLSVSQVRCAVSDDPESLQDPDQQIRELQRRRDETLRQLEQLKRRLEQQQQ